MGLFHEILDQRGRWTFLGQTLSVRCSSPFRYSPRTFSKIRGERSKKNSLFTEVIVDVEKTHTENTVSPGSNRLSVWPCGPICAQFDHVDQSALSWTMRRVNQSPLTLKYLDKSALSWTVRGQIGAEFDHVDQSSLSLTTWTNQRSVWPRGPIGAQFDHVDLSALSLTPPPKWPNRRSFWPRGPIGAHLDHVDPSALSLTSWTNRGTVWYVDQSGHSQTLS